MNLFIHLAIAYALKKVIHQKFSVKINTTAFLFGSIKPDLFPTTIKAPHEIHHSKEFILEQVRNLEGEVLKDRKCSWEFSERLGIVTHYLSDFFCYAHSERYGGNALQHYLYEFKHMKYSFKNLMKIMGDRFHGLYSGCETYTKGMFLEEQYERYTSKKSSSALDMMYCLKVNAKYCCFIIGSCVLK